MSLTEKLKEVQAQKVDVGSGFNEQRQMYDKLQESGLIKEPAPMTVPKTTAPSAAVNVHWRLVK